MERSEDPLQIFGIKVRRKIIRFDQSATQYGDLPSLGRFVRLITLSGGDLIATPRDRSGEQVPSAGNCPNEAPVMISKGATNIADAMGKGFVCYGDRRPYRIDQLVLRNQPAGILNKVFQDPKALGSQLHLAIVGADTAAPKIEREPGETEHFFTDCLHRALQRTSTMASGRFHHFWRGFAPNFHDAGSQLC
jgi:hypothetical protein